CFTILTSVCGSSLSTLLCSTFFFCATSATDISTLSLHDALPICSTNWRSASRQSASAVSTLTATKRSASPGRRRPTTGRSADTTDRKSTRLNSSHDQISYAVFCLKKKKTSTPTT